MIATGVMPAPGVPTKPPHRWIHVVLIVLVMVLQIITIGIQVSARQKYDISKEWYGKKQASGIGPGSRPDRGDDGKGDPEQKPEDDDVNKRQPLSLSYRKAHYNIEFGPPRWLLDMMWPLLFIYQLVWQAYGLCTIARISPDGQTYLYSKPYYMPVAMYISYTITIILRLTWSTLLPRCSAVCTGLLAGSFISATIATAIAMRALYREGASLARLGLFYDIWVVRGVVHNGLAAYASWEFLALCFGLMGEMGNDGYSQRDSSTTMLALGLMMILVYSLMDLFFLEKYMRYTFSPYVVHIIVHAALIDSHWYNGSVSFLGLLSLIFSLLLIVIKIVIILGKRAQNRDTMDMSKNISNQPQAQVPGRMIPLRMSAQPHTPLFSNSNMGQTNFQFTYM